MALWLLLSTLQQVSCQPFFGSLPPLPSNGVRLFLGEENIAIANFSMIAAGLFHDVDSDGPGGAIGVTSGADGQNDGLWCQSSLNESMIGTWYRPNGTEVSRMASSPLYSNNSPTGQIGLLRNGGISPTGYRPAIGYEGLYRCVIPNEEGVNQTLYVATYGNGEFNKDDELPVIDDFLFQLLSSVDTDPPVLSLLFNVTNRSPTNVTCYIDGNQFIISDNDLLRIVIRSEDPITVQVSVIVRVRITGLYQCNFTTDKITSTPLTATAKRNITVTGSPADLKYSRDHDLTMVRLDWSPSVMVNVVPVYQLFINSDGITTSNSTSDDYMDLPLQLDCEYSITLVAIGEDLPSDILTITIPQVVSAVIEGPSTLQQNYSSTFSLLCKVTVATEVSIAQVNIDWIHPNGTAIASTNGTIALDSSFPMISSMNDSAVYIHELKFTTLQASHVGEYTCRAMINDSVITRSFFVSIQIPTPVVVSSVNTTGRIFESTDVSLLCNVIVAPLDVESVVNITWFGPNGTIAINGTQYIFNTDRTLLKFTTAVSDNGTQYYCTANYGASVTAPQFSLIYSSTATSNITIVNVEVVPSADLLVQAVGIPVRNESFAVVCTGTAPSNVMGLATVSVQWQLNGAEFTDATLEGVSVTNGGSVVTLNFSSLNNVTHERNYMCVATLTVINVPIMRNSSTTYILITLSNPVVSVSSSGSILANNTLILECTVTVVAGVLNITWLNETGDQLIEGNGIMFNLVTMSAKVQVYQLIFNPLDYSHIGGYTCQANLTVSSIKQPFIGKGSDTTIVNVQVPVPQVRIFPVMTPLIRGTERTITCDVIFIPPLPDNPDVSFTVLKDGVEVSFENDTKLTAVWIGTTGSLTFRPLDFSDSGNYTCVATARDSVNNPLIIPSSASDYYNATVEAITVPVITFTATPCSQLLVGESLLLNCAVDVLDDLYNINADVRIVRSDGEVVTRSGNTTLNYTLNPLRSSDAGGYQCLVNITQVDINYQLNDTESTQVNLTIPTPIVTVSVNATNHVEGQFLDVTCRATVSEYVNTDVTVSMTWRRNGTVLTNGSDFIIGAMAKSEFNNEYTSILRVNSLRYEADNGAAYNCSASITSNDLHVLPGNNSSSATTLTVQNFDVNHVDIDIIVPSVPVAGQAFNLTCHVDVPDRFTENFTYFRWNYDLGASQDVTAINSDASVGPIMRNSDTFTSVLTLNPVRTNDATRYYCQATIIVFGTVDRTSRDLTVQTFPPSVSLTADPPTGPIYESTAYRLICTATVNTTIVNTPVTASVVWTDPRGMIIPVGNPRRRVEPPSGSNLISSLLFLPIDIGHYNDNGTYTCAMTLNSADSLITSSQPTSTTINVTVEHLPNMTVVFSSVGSVIVGQSLTVTCTITAVARLAVTPHVTIIKINETAMEMLSDLNVPYSITTDDTGAVTNYTLMFNSLRFEDAGMYTCMAEFNVTGYNNTDDSATETGDMQEASDSFNLVVNCNVSLIPLSAATNVTFSAGATSANISFVIPMKTLYVPEKYHINYTGLNFQTTQLFSVSKMSSRNITANDERFTIMLTYLEEDNVYKFTVDSTNCVGTAHTETMNFTTLSALPTSSPTLCMNATFLPRNVTLIWTEPTLIDQNGAAVGYHLTCTSISGILVNGLSATQYSTNTMFMITDVMPFTSYTCNLRFINVIGEGPPTQCSFDTAQDRPDDSPQNFTAIATKATVLFKWTKPGTPNGIITKYFLIVTKLDTLIKNNYTINVTNSQATVLQVIDGFSPYQSYTASVSASTIIGSGPVATTTGQTLPDTSSSPLIKVTPVFINSLTVAYTVPVLNDTTINITWSPPSYPNGDITGYIVRIATDATITSSNVPFISGKVSYTLFFGGLKPRVPYYISVVAINQIGEGNSATATVFTKSETIVTVSPSNLQAVRVGNTIQISWDPVSLEEAKGFFVYRIRLASGNSNTLRQANTRTISVAFSVTSVNITDIDPRLTYTVSINVLLLSDLGLIEGPTVQISLAMSPTDSSDDVSTSVPVIVSVVVFISTVILIIVIGILVAVYKKNFKKINISKTKEVNVLPNAGYGLANVASNTAMRNDDGVYEKIDDCLYEQVDDKPVLQQQENTSVVGGSVDDIAITSCPAYETTTSFTANTVSVSHEEPNDEQEIENEV